MLPEQGADFASPPNVETERSSASDTAFEAIAPLANLPLFFKLSGREAVIAGGSEPAAWKAELLAAAGAKVVVFAAELSEKMIEVVARQSAIRVKRRGWRPDDLADAAIAVGNFADPAESAAFREAGRAVGAPVNIIDQPEFCDFSFGAIVNRSPLVIGVSTDGAAPVFGQVLRGRLEALIPQGFAAWAAAAARWRELVRDASFRSRRAFWERFAALALAKADYAPTEEDRLALIAASLEESAPAAGEAIIIGGGTGRAELLTLKAWRALQSAEAIVFDDGVATDCLDLARREARRIKAGSEVVGTIVALCREGKAVVRLRSGDVAPTDHESAALRAAGITCSIVPGVAVTAASASERQS